MTYPAVLTPTISVMLDNILYAPLNASSPMMTVHLGTDVSESGQKKCSLSLEPF